MVFSSFNRVSTTGREGQSDDPSPRGRPSDGGPTLPWCEPLESETFPKCSCHDVFRIRPPTVPSKFDGREAASIK